MGSINRRTEWQRTGLDPLVGKTFLHIRDRDTVFLDWLEARREVDPLPMPIFYPITDYTRYVERPKIEDSFYELVYRLNHLDVFKEKNIVTRLSFDLYAKDQL